jgi:hypothetical protein
MLFIVSTRQQWQLPYLAEFTVDICHVGGKSRMVADVQAWPAVVSTARPLAPKENGFSVFRKEAE